MPNHGCPLPRFQYGMYFLVFFLVISIGSSAKVSKQDSCGAAYDNVNPFIGSSGPGFGYGGMAPAAQLPFSPLRLGPDTTTKIADLTFRHFSGYNYLDDTIRAFSHTRLVGAGVTDLGNFGIMPTHFPSNDNDQSVVSTNKEKPYEHFTNRFWWSTFNKSTESAEPGRYTVTLDRTHNRSGFAVKSGNEISIDNSINVDLLAIGRLAGIHRYQWNNNPFRTKYFEGGNAGAIPALVFDMCHSAKIEEGISGDRYCVNATVNINSPSINAINEDAVTDVHSITGKVFFDGSLSHGIWVYLYAEVKILTPCMTIENWISCTDYNGTCATSITDTDITSDSGALFSTAKIIAGNDCVGANSLQESVNTEIRVGISFISEDLAKRNLQDALYIDNDLSIPNGMQMSGDRIKESFNQDLPPHISSQKITNSFKGLQFEEYQARTKRIWCETLNGLSIEAFSSNTSDNTVSWGSDRERVTESEDSADILSVLYSAQYRTYLTPTIYTESGGLYLGMDLVVHNSTNDRRSSNISDEDMDILKTHYSDVFYSDLSLWDTFRTQHPWLLLREEPVALGIVQSMADITDQQGAFPRWVLASTESGCMMGEHGAAAVLEALCIGWGTLFDVDMVQSTLLKQATEEGVKNGRKDIEHYMSSGYVSQDYYDDATSLTLSYSFDDAVLAGISEFVGDTDAARDATERSFNYRNVWSAEKMFFCPKYEDETMKCPNTGHELTSWQYYKEGDALHWGYYVLHNPQDLVSLYPSATAFRTTLQSFFENHIPYQEKLGSFAPNPFYWAGNEHAFMTPWLFNFIPGAPNDDDEASNNNSCIYTQYWTRRILPMHFSNTPHGIPGNDDYASMSSWALFTSIGLYPIAGTTTYTIGSPSVASATLRLHQIDPSTGSKRNGGDAILDIKTYNNSVDNVYVEKLLVNGKSHSSAFIDRAALVGELIFEHREKIAKSAVGAATRGAVLEFFMTATPSSQLCPL